MDLLAVFNDKSVTRRKDTLLSGGIHLLQQSGR